MIPEDLQSDFWYSANGRRIFEVVVPITGIHRNYYESGMFSRVTEPRHMAENGERQPLLEARAVCRSFDNGRIDALRGVDLTIARGEFVAILGPSGSGKSTLLNLMGGLDHPTSGEILYENRPLHTMQDPATFRSRTIGFIFQSYHLLPTLTALENVQIPMFEMGWRAATRRERARTLLDRVGLADRLHQMPSQLSGGERQRVAIARSLANEPNFLLADEPTGNLDSENARSILELLQALQKERGATLVVVTHDPEIAAHVRRRIHLLDGRVVEDANTSVKRITSQPGF
jgi:putative ABC transport system ATP-binding protein